MGRLRGWRSLYALSWKLGARYLLRHGWRREAAIRLLIPLDPSRYLELPDVLAELPAKAGDRVLDLASPKLAAVALADRGVEVTSVDLLDRELDSWRRLAGDRERLRFVHADGRDLPYPDASFDHCYSVSVLEHIPDDGDERALCELGRVARPTGRVVVTLPYAERYREDWRDQPVYGDQPSREGRYFFERWYDADRIERLIGVVPKLSLVSSRVSRMSPNWHRLYIRYFPWLIPLGPFFGLIGRERVGPPGDVIRLTLTRTAA
jgi:SAM-dependent methyltransferase